MHMTHRWGAIAGATALVILGAGAPAGASALQEDPAGDNGTVKIDDVPFDDHPNNEPHVACEFQVDFYGFDEGDFDATVTFTLVPPTGDNEDILDDLVFIGEDPADGGTDLDASETYDLSELLAGVEPHAQQGIHLRLTVHAEGSQGADTKFKEFWVTGCGVPPTTSTPTTSTTKPGNGSTTTSSTSTTSTSTPGGSTTSTTKPGVVPSTSPSTTPPGGPTTTAPAGPKAQQPEGQLPKTGSDATPLAAAGLALVTLGAAAVVAGIRLNRARSGA
jgi:LPXTG-motif cell wall-anchored protein